MKTLKSLFGILKTVFEGGLLSLLNSNQKTGNPPQDPTGKPPAGSESKPSVTRIAVGEKLFHVKVKDEQKGPYTLGQIRSMWDNGQITADAVARCSDSAEWFSLEQRITGAEENVEPQQQAVAAPSAKSLLTKPSFVRKYKRIPTIGKRGWLGLALVIFGMFWFINAKSAAEESGKQVWASGSYKYAELTGLAETAGYASYYDFLVNQNQTHSLGLIGFGTVLVVSGYWKYGRKRCRTVG